MRERADDRRRRRRRRVSSLFSSLSVDVSPKSNTGSCLARMRMLLILLCSSLLWPTPLIHGVGSDTQRGTHAHAHTHTHAHTCRQTSTFTDRHCTHSDTYDILYLGFHACNWKHTDKHTSA